jgi:hypothetical protein
MPFLYPPIPLSLKDAATIMLPVTAALLGLIYAGLIFWLQGGFAGLEYTASILRPVISSSGKVVLDLLVGATAVSLFALLHAPYLISAAFWIFALVFVMDVFKASAAQGYVVTLFSSKMVPAGYGPKRRFFRHIRNAGLQGWPRILLWLLICIGYPVAVSFTFRVETVLTDKATIIFIFAATAMSLVQIRSLLTQALEARIQIERDMQKESEKQAMGMEEKTNPWPNQKRRIEQRIIAERLQSIGVVPWLDVPSLAEADSWTSRDLKNKPVLEGQASVQEYGNCHLNILIPYLQDDQLTREFIFHWSRVILETLSESQTEVRQYALSFRRREGPSGTQETHFAIIRAGKDDIRKALAKKGSDEEFVRSLPGKYLSPAVAEY